MIGMTGRAGRAARPAVKATALLRQPADVLVAAGAEPVHRLGVPGPMTLPAAQRSLQPGMGLRQRTGRDLPAGRRCPGQEPGQQQRRPSPGYQSHVAPTATTTPTWTSTATRAPIANGRCATCQSRKIR